ncbi:hypothetical protein [Clostridium sporogenes]|uniref:hypothetical protein n=1 Tax=Clostridium sporogenes TaxID=1509 RepID=UPI0007177A90|nr:hypothetical protein [Clostridium sporogenes]KRU40050.1 hypothetical protein VT94_25270 [Clostridium sporogenes]MBY7065135.1 hypothetical protein [Clostridium sporogenes]MBY7071819.1 hypothetical protein [Clostridium sporogenes]MCW6065877.1 hypothetical protein [Clostridium sporogenes]OQP88552.1 hypothetical protein VT93_0201960 [Clostridium sporogenes]
MEEKKLRRNNSIMKIINNFFFRLKEKEFKKIVVLDIYRCFKILAAIWGYTLWVFIAQIGFNNLYAVVNIFDLQINDKAAVNSFGNALFNVLLITLIMFSVFELIRCLSSQSIDYIKILYSLKNELNSVLRLGTLIFLLGIYACEINLKEYKSFLILILFQLSLFGIFTFLEKRVFNQIKKDIEKDIEIKNFNIETSYGMFNNISLQVFSAKSKWKKYIFRSKHYGKNIFYNEEIYRALKDTNALRGNEPVLLKDFFGDYEMIIVPVPTKNN